MGSGIRRAGVLTTLIIAWACPHVMAATPPAPPIAIPAASPVQTQPAVATYRNWIVAMKAQPLGPFTRIRYFCHDGTVLEPKAFSCEPHGGGYQHGEWSDQTRRIRAAGYPIANLMVSVDPQQLVGASADPDLLASLIVERFLIAHDNGWIFRRAQYYRGAVQDHNEKEAARLLLTALASSNTTYIELREAARSFAHGADTPSLTRVRGMATTLDEKDPQFNALRSRIHNSPEAGDAARVRAYAISNAGKPALKAEYETLAAAIDQAYQPRPLSADLGGLRRVLRGKSKTAVEDYIRRSLAAEGPQGTIGMRMQAAADTMVWLRDQAWADTAPASRLAIVDVSLAAENAYLVSASQLLPRMSSGARADYLKSMAVTTRALYGAGLLTGREWKALDESLGKLDGSIKLAEYRDELEYLQRAASWCAQRLQYHFGGGMERLRPLEPAVEGFVPDRLRASPLLLYSALLQTLREDADALGGVGQSLLGENAGGGLRRLNPGIARGVLRTQIKAEDGDAPAIYLVPETTSDLPSVAGILTEQEGNPVSHVQLLARNLGIPNVVVSAGLIPKIKAYENRRLVVAASPGGRVEIAEDSAAWDKLLGSGDSKSSVVIVPDLAKLDLLRVDFVSTAVLRASDSGRIVGPKAAHVGELSHRFPGQVSPGLAVSFGVYRELLKLPVKAGGPPMFEWMRRQYADIAVRRRLDPAGHAERVSAMLGFVRNWIAGQSLPLTLELRLHDAMIQRFGLDGTYGVFVRSDTNIEDLPGFTGAGLNLTIPNVVGFDSVLKALRQVWASPFTERAYGWRQDLMDQPEHVYVSVLLHQSVPNEKSGVMITADVDTGDRDTLTVATSLGVGGGVDGEAAESLRVDIDSGKARLLSSATARSERRMMSVGGARMIAAPAPDAVLSDKEIQTLAEFAKGLPKRYPELQDDENQSTPADVEFGFVKGKLMLQQIRPFLQNRSASRQEYLAKMDKELRSGSKRRVDLDEKPETSQ